MLWPRLQKERTLDLPGCAQVQVIFSLCYFLRFRSGVCVRTDPASLLASAGVARPVRSTLDAVEATRFDERSFFAIFGFLQYPRLFLLTFRAPFMH
jgi:hypothetical protein